LAKKFKSEIDKYLNSFSHSILPFWLKAVLCNFKQKIHLFNWHKLLTYLKNFMQITGFQVLKCTKGNAFLSVHRLLQLIAMWKKNKLKKEISYTKFFQSHKERSAVAWHYTGFHKPHFHKINDRRISLYRNLSNLDESLASTEKSHLKPWIKYGLRCTDLH